MSPWSGDAGPDAGDLKGPPVGKPSARRRKLKIWGAIVLLLIVVAIGLGAGLGLGLNRDSSDDETDPRDSPPLPSATGHPDLWQPEVGTSWQIILSQELVIDHNDPVVTPDVEVFDIDMFLHQNTTVIDSLHKLGKKAICYFSGGSYEPYRPDSYRFQKSDMGDTLDGWEDEKWLNISSPSIRQIMADRVDIAIAMGCDAIDPDNMDGFTNDNGLGLTAEDSVSFVKFLAERAARKNVAIGLKNAPDIIADVLDDVQFAVNEECAEQDGCEDFSAFVKAGKPVFHIEYPSGVSGRKIAAAASRDSCTAKGMSGFSTVLKDKKLDSWVEYCDGKTSSTNVVD